MSFWKQTFVPVLEAAGITAAQVGLASLPTVLNTLSPGLGIIANVVIQSIFQAQAQHGNGNGDSKLTTALTQLQTATPAIAATLTATTGHDVANPSLLARGLGKILDGAVDVMNAMKLLPSSTDPTAGINPSTTPTPVTQTVTTPQTVVTISTTK